MPEPKRCSCCEKHTLRAEEEKKKLLNRLRRIEGQVRGLQAMVESNAYCNDILTQSAAVNAAVNAFNRNKFPAFCHCLKSLASEIFLHGRIMLFECLREFSLAALTHGHKV